MGIHSWRCAKTTKGIPVQRYELSEIIAFLPDGKRVSGFLSDYGELLAAEYVDTHNQPLPEKENFPEYSTQPILDLYAKAMSPPAQPTPEGDYRLADIERIASMVKLVRADEVEPSDTFDQLPVSEPDPWQGYLYEIPEQWKLPLAEAAGIETPSDLDPMYDIGMDIDEFQDDSPSLS